MLHRESPVCLLEQLSQLQPHESQGSREHKPNDRIVGGTSLDEYWAFDGAHCFASSKRSGSEVSKCSLAKARFDRRPSFIRVAHSGRNGRMAGRQFRQERLADACAVLSVVRRTMIHVSQGDPLAVRIAASVSSAAASVTGAESGSLVERVKSRNADADGAGQPFKAAPRGGVLTGHQEARSNDQKPSAVGYRAVLVRYIAP